jgi:hypothetical protein
LADANARAASLQARIKHLGAGAEACAANFLEVVKARRGHRLVPERAGTRPGARPARCRCRNDQQRNRRELQLNWAIVPQNSGSTLHTFAKVPCDTRNQCLTG